MMGQQTGIQPKIFYPHLNLEQRVPRTHLLRRIQEQIDFNFIYAEVRNTYGSKGNVSIPPPVILKMMLLLVLYNVRSERELMETIPMRLSWLWFLGYDIAVPTCHRFRVEKLEPNSSVKCHRCDNPAPLNILLNQSEYQNDPTPFFIHESRKECSCGALPADTGTPSSAPVS